jgi:RNA polymerase sigma factor (sigma-70 family)
VPHSRSRRTARFPSTQWSIVVKAGGDSPEGHHALERLCKSYWLPIYAFARRKQRSSADEARDLTQAFFARLIARNDFAAADREKGRFRSFLLRAFENFLADQRDRAGALKRGGGVQFLSLDELDAEERQQIEPIDAESPEHLYDRQWALLILSRVTERLREEQIALGKGEQFEALSPFLAGDSGRSYSAAAERLDTTEGAAKMAVSRLRQRFRALLRAQIAETLADPGDVDEELRDLQRALRG